MKKNLISLSLCLILILSLPLSVFAAQEANIIQKVQIAETDMQMLCVCPEEGDVQFQVLLDGNQLPSEKSDIRTEQTPATVFCLVDTSGSISQFKMKLIQETLTELSNSLGENDNMVIATLSNDMVVGPMLNTQEERNTAIAGLAGNHQDTNLYGGIVQSLERLSSDNTYNEYRCLVILSDGVEGQDNGMTEQEVINAVDAARLPVFTVALVEEYTEREGGKILGSFARSSYGGIHQTTSNEGGDKHIRWNVSGTEFGSVIYNAIQDTVVLHADLSELNVDTAKNEVRLELNCTVGTNDYTDYLYLNANDLPVIPGETEPETETQPATEEPVEEPTEETQPPEPTFWEKNWIWLVIAAVVLVGGTVALILIRKSRKKPALDDDNMITREQSGDLGVTIGLTEEAQSEPVVQNAMEQTQTLQQQYKVHMTDIPYGTQSLQFVINAVEVVTFGRDANRAKCIVNATDTQLSGVHFALTLQKNQYCIRDEGSSNGTYLNGVSIPKGSWMKLQSGDKVRAGAYEYRMTIERIK